jgi:hypothetical protein
MREVVMDTNKFFTRPVKEEPRRGLLIDNIVKGEISTRCDPEGDVYEVFLRLSINGEEFRISKPMYRVDLLRMDKRGATKLIADALADAIMERFE